MNYWMLYIMEIKLENSLKKNRVQLPLNDEIDSKKTAYSCYFESTFKKILI